MRFNWILAGLGAALMGLNLYGLGHSMRNPEILTEPKVSFINDITLSESDFYREIDMSHSSSQQEYLLAANLAVNRGIAHYWLDEGADKYSLRIPARENFVLFFMSYLMPEKFEKYEFTNYRRAVERGLGLCSQQSIILSEVLNERGIPARIVTLNGHVVVTAPMDKSLKNWWVLDPDHGVSLPFDLQTIEADLDLIDPLYRQAGHGETIIEQVRGFFEVQGNQIKQLPGVLGYAERAYYFESLAYVVKWALPLALLAAPLIFGLKKRSQQS